MAEIGGRTGHVLALLSLLAALVPVCALIGVFGYGAYTEAIWITWLVEYVVGGVGGGDLGMIVFAVIMAIGVAFLGSVLFYSGWVGLLGLRTLGAMAVSVQSGDPIPRSVVAGCAAVDALGAAALYAAHRFHPDGPFAALAIVSIVAAALSLAALPGGRRT